MAAMANLPMQKANLKNDYQTYMLNNTKATKQFGVQLIELKSQINAISNPQQYQAAQQGFTSLKKEISAVGATGRSMFGELGNDIKKFAYWTIAGSVLMGFLNSIRQIVTNVADLNTAMVNIQMATGDNIQQAQGLMNTYNQMAKTLGATTVEVADSANSFLRQGKSVEETNTLIRDSMILSKVGMIDSATATQYLTSAMKGNIYSLYVQKCA